MTSQESMDALACTVYECVLYDLVASEELEHDFPTVSTSWGHPSSSDLPCITIDIQTDSNPKATVDALVAFVRTLAVSVVVQFPQDFEARAEQRRAPRRDYVKLPPPPEHVIRSWID